MFEFTIPNDNNYWKWAPDTNCCDLTISKIADRFIALKPTEKKLFFVWGHSYQFQRTNGWTNFDKFCGQISNKSDIWYATNMEIILYLKAVNKLIISNDRMSAQNPTTLSIWVQVGTKYVEIKPGATLDVNTVDM